MITSILNDVIELPNQTTSGLKEYFSFIGLNSFDNIFVKYTVDNEPYCIIKYILFAYSEDSPYLIMKSEDKQQKHDICEHLQIPEYLHPNLIGLVDIEIREAALSYLQRFGSEIFRNLTFLKEQLHTFNTLITERKFTDEGGILDTKRHMEAVRETTRLSKGIVALEQEYKLKHPKLAGINRLKTELLSQKKKNNKTGGSVETSNFID